MFIVLQCGGLPFNGETIHKRSLGGSETAAYYLAKELARMGHRVRLFTNCSEAEEGEWDGVRYVSAGQANERYPLGIRFHLYATQTPHDVLIVQRHPLALREKYACKQAYLWMHDLALQRNRAAYDSGFWQMTGAFVVSEFHKAQVEKVLNVQPRVVLPITNGVDPERFVIVDKHGRETKDTVLVDGFEVGFVWDDDKSYHNSSYPHVRPWKRDKWFEHPFVTLLYSVIAYAPSDPAEAAGVLRNPDAIRRARRELERHDMGEGTIRQAINGSERARLMEARAAIEQERLERGARKRWERDLDPYEREAERRRHAGMSRGGYS